MSSYIFESQVTDLVATFDNVLGIENIKTDHDYILEEIDKFEPRDDVNKYAYTTYSEGEKILMCSHLFLDRIVIPDDVIGVQVYHLYLTLPTNPTASNNLIMHLPQKIVRLQFHDYDYSKRLPSHLLLVNAEKPIEDLEFFNNITNLEYLSCQINSIRGIYDFHYLKSLSITTQSDFSFELDQNISKYLTTLFISCRGNLKMRGLQYIQNLQTLTLNVGNGEIIFFEPISCPTVVIKCESARALLFTPTVKSIDLEISDDCDLSEYRHKYSLDNVSCLDYLYIVRALNISHINIERLHYACEEEINFPPFLKWLKLDHYIKKFRLLHLLYLEIEGRCDEPIQELEYMNDLKTYTPQLKCLVVNCPMERLINLPPGLLVLYYHPEYQSFITGDEEIELELQELDIPKSVKLLMMDIKYIPLLMILSHISFIVTHVDKKTRQDKTYERELNTLTHSSRRVMPLKKYINEKLKTYATLYVIQDMNMIDFNYIKNVINKELKSGLYMLHGYMDYLEFMD